ncbi:unnamed protein product [Gulo gulo]|uniref:Uncharacterized protein n=1 Tax=Gulo gulo TaxID=48420 RepID=A0A9X9LRJ4_GULGU|nr:unnamed protein product [Gulo gulo]
MKEGTTSSGQTAAQQPSVLNTLGRVQGRVQGLWFGWTLLHGASLLSR